MFKRCALIFAVLVGGVTAVPGTAFADTLGPKGKALVAHVREADEGNGRSGGHSQEFWCARLEKAKRAARHDGRVPQYHILNRVEERHC